MVGRRSELRFIGELLQRVRDGGGAVVVRGEAGIGKSAVLSEVIAHSEVKLLDHLDRLVRRGLWPAPRL
jgi:predicted ATP-dependent serine protease